MSKIALALFALLYLHSSEATNASYHFHLDYSSQDLLISTFKADERISFAYALIDQEGDDRNVTLGIKTWESETHKTCTLGLSVDRDKVFERRYKLVQIDDDTLVFAWLEAPIVYRRCPGRESQYRTKTLHIRIVRLSTCAYGEDEDSFDDKVYYVGNQKEIKDLDIINDRSGYIAFRYRNQVYCDQAGGCSVAVVASSWKWKNSSDSFSREDPIMIYPILPAYADECKVLLIADNFHGSDSPIPLASEDANGKSGYCERGVGRASKITCQQFNQTNAVLLNFEMEDNGVRFARLHNLKNAGLVLMSGREEDKTEAGFKKLYLDKIDEEGTKERRELENVEYPEGEWRFDAGFFDKEGFEYCYYLSYERETENRYDLRINTECFE